LGLFSSATGLPDGMGLDIAGGTLKLRQEAAVLGVGVQEVAAVHRSTAAGFGGRANIAAHGLRAIEYMAKLTRGQRNPNLGTPSRNAAVRDLGMEVGSFVMGKDEWADYIKTSTLEMPFLDRPFGFKATTKLAKDRPSGARDGWKFARADVSKPRWSMTDRITYRLPDHTEKFETLRAAISDIYHLNWTLHLRLLNKNKKDEEAGKEVSRSSRKS